MHSDRNENNPRSANRVLIASAALLIIAVGLLGFSIIRSRAEAVQTRRGFTLSGGASPYYSAAGNGLAAVTTEGAQLFSSAGKCVAELSADFQNPRCAAGSKLAVFWDSGKAGFRALYPNGTDAAADSDGSVYFAEVNEAGLVTVLTDKEGSLGSVVVYDDDLTPLFRLVSSSVTPVTARTTADGLLCMNGTGSDGGYLRFYRIDSEDMQAEYFSPDEPIADFGFLSDGSVAVVTESALLFISADGALLSEYRFEGASVSAAFLSGSFAAVAVPDASGDGRTEILTFAPGGEPIGSFFSDAEVLDFSAYGTQLLVLFAGSESTLFSSELEEIVSYQPTEDVRQVFLYADSRALFAGESGAVQLDFNR